MVKLYFDEEFTSLSTKAELLSIGIVTNDDRFFYAEITDFNRDNISEWVFQHVIQESIFLAYTSDAEREEAINRMANDIDKDSIMMFGKKKEVAAVLLEWLESFNDDIQFISDVEQYDMVLLNDLLSGGKTALDVPNFICSDCVNINTLLAEYKKVSIREAFNLRRENFVDVEHVKETLGIGFEMKHNSLWDAFVIKEICKNINKSISCGYLIW